MITHNYIEHRQRLRREKKNARLKFRYGEDNPDDNYKFSLTLLKEGTNFNSRPQTASTKLGN